jgi:hypothetical protein
MTERVDTSPYRYILTQAKTTGVPVPSLPGIASTELSTTP